MLRTNPGPVVFVVIFLVIAVAACFIGYKRTVSGVSGNCTIGESTVYDAEKSILSQAFREPVETIYCVCYNGRIWSYTSLEEYRINITATDLNNAMKKNGMTLVDIAYVVHNHFGMTRMSPGDKAFLQAMIARGFRGAFAIYSQGSKKVEVWRVECR
jgi:GTP-dependent phosphoenolpyruvate carboxykinase